MISELHFNAHPYSMALHWYSMSFWCNKTAQMLHAYITMGQHRVHKCTSFLCLSRFYTKFRLESYLKLFWSHDYFSCPVRRLVLKFYSTTTRNNNKRNACQLFILKIKKKFIHWGSTSLIKRALLTRHLFFITKKKSHNKNPTFQKYRNTHKSMNLHLSYLM